MTLKEKFKKATSQWFDVTECEEIAQEHALEVMEWYRQKCIMSNFDMIMTAKQAFELYKKENDL
jgi:hypothetical protein